MEKKKITLVHKKYNSYITIYDDIITFSLGSKFVPVVSIDNKFLLVLLDDIARNYKFPNDCDSMIIKYLKGYDDTIKFEYY